MEFEVHHESKMKGMRAQYSSMGPLTFKRVPSRHKRSKSCPVKKPDEDESGNSHQNLNHLQLDLVKVKDPSVLKKKQSPQAELQSSLKREILQLERRLQDQISVRWALEKALGHRSSYYDTSSTEFSMPKPAKKLLKEIAVLELEVAYLEQHLLSLYRRAFDSQMASFSPSNIDERSRSTLRSNARLFQESRRLDITPRRASPPVRSGRMFSPDAPINSSREDLSDTGSIKRLQMPTIQRSQSSLTQCSVCSNRISPPKKNPGPTKHGHHSHPLSLLEEAENGKLNVISLAEHLGARISDHVPETPSSLSEEMIRQMGAIYCKLAEPPLEHNGLSSSPTSSFLSSSVFSAQDQCDVWSTHYKKEPPYDIRLENLFRIESDQEFSGPYSTMVEVPRFSRGQLKQRDVQHMLQNYRLLVQRLEKVDPTKMKNEEKLAFWINIHNALVMHAYVHYGIPQTIKRGSLLSKAAYNVGGRSINAETIQNYILGCRTHRPGQWLRSFFSSRMKFDSGDDWQAFAIKSREPLLHFALCGGSYSDPAVRAYTAKRVVQELEVAKEEYIEANVNINKVQKKIVVPKMIEAFARDSNVSRLEVVNSIQQHLPKRCQKGKSRKSVEWVPHNFSFRYLIPKQLVN